MNNSNSILIGDMHIPNQEKTESAIMANHGALAAWTCFLLSGAALLTAVNFALL